MEDLMALESLEAVLSLDGTRSDIPEAASGSGSMPPSSTRSKSPCSDRVRAYASPASISKRRRRGSPGGLCKGESSAGVGASDVVKFEEEEDQVSGKPSDGVDRNCVGCNRSALHGHDWFDNSEPVPWAFSHHRGHWCRDCHGTWRVCYSLTHSLSLFSRWLDMADNRISWEFNMVSYLTLILDGQQRITNEMVQARVKVIRFMEDILGWSFVASSIMSLDRVQRDFPDFVVPPNALTTMISQSGPQVGVRLPNKMLAAILNGKSVSRPPSFPPLLASRGDLATAVQGDATLLQNIFGIDTQMPTLVAKSEPEEPQARVNKLQVRMEAVLTSAQRLADQFACNIWDQVKESQFTGLVNKLSGFLTEAETQGDEVVVAKTSAWVQGLSHGKAYCKAYREYMKSNSKHAKMMELLPPLKIFIPFLQDTCNITIYATFNLLWHKVMLFEGAASTSIESAVQTAVANGVVAALEAADSIPHGDGHTKFSAVAWLRSVMLQLWCDALAAQTDESEVDFKRASSDLSKQVDGVVTVFGQQGFIIERCAEVFDDTKHLAELLRCAVCQGSCKASDVGTALSVLKEKRLHSLHKAMYNTGLGKHIMSHTSLMLQVSAKDKAADDKVRRASEILEDDRLPRLGQPPEGSNSDECDAVLENFGLVIDNSFTDVLHESLDLVSEATKLWASSRLRDQVSPISAWGELFVRQATFLSECLSLYLQALLHDSGFYNLVGGAVMADESQRDDDNSARVPTWGEVVTLVDFHMPDEEKLENLVTNFVAFMEKMMPAELRKCLPWKEWCARLRESVSQNCAARSAVQGLIRALSEVDDVPRCSSDMLIDWRNKQSSGKESASFLMRAVRINDAGLMLQQAPFLLFDWQEDDLRLMIDEGSGVKVMTCSCKRVATLHADVLACSLYTEATGAIKDVLQLVVDEFADAIFTSSIGMPTKILDGMSEESTAMSAKSFLVGDRVPEAMKVATKVFAVGRKEHDWSGVSLLRLMVKLLDIAPKETALVSADKLCTAGDGPLVWASVDDCKRTCSLLLGMSQVAISLAWLGARVFGTDAIVRDNKPKEEVEKAITFVRSLCLETLDGIAKGEQLSKAVIEMPWLAPLSFSQVWFSIARESIEVVSRCFLVKYLTAMRVFSDELGKTIPNYEHIVGGRVCNMELAKSNLLGWPSRSQLSANAKTMFHFLAQAKRLHTQWALAPGLLEDATMKDDVESCEHMYESAARAVVIIAGFSILLECASGDDQRDRAKQLLSLKATSLPDAMKVKLMKVAGLSVAPATSGTAPIAG